ncbi:DUF5946 family protein [Actinotalea fermentans]|uniref:Uncharacterized protein n=1 Tax=Actinotalea fermentans TaxID=43671 RepID=A0A511YZ16_9CELL|nr:DUF5946 family protein [Actinotalea fermentans]KGM15623.1 hypothetical protein N867_06940 [Actinotalea fermentans ATCC 43279 = JCM 9966 = DSM 3133]GEN80424.1 hypothetical protein AFE02nite_21580 [Actinotalea fermentans]
MTSVPRAGECPECGAVTRLHTCHDLFMTLLSYDHEQRQPWAAFHTLNVACYLLQHPSQGTAASRAGQWLMVRTFVDHGIDAVHALARAAVRRNSHRHGGRGGLDADLPAPPPPVRHPAVTIHTVAVDGTFPAAGYESRMRDWAAATLASRAPDGAPG